jgi:hypothetical protein
MTTDGDNNTDEEGEEVWLDNIKDVLAERRFQEQCYLIEHFKDICAFNSCVSYWSPFKKGKKAKKEVSLYGAMIQEILALCA